jgi:hypothetical protein
MKGYADLAFNFMQMQQEKKNLRKLEAEQKALAEQPFAEYSVSPELRQAYQEASGRFEEYKRREKTGFSAEQRAAIDQGLATQERMNRENAAMAGGGQAAGFISALNTNNFLNSTLDLALKDAEIQGEKRRMTDQMMREKAASAGSLQNQENIVTQGRQLRRQFIEMQLGGAMRDTRERLNQATYGTLKGPENIQQNMQNDAASLFRASNGGAFPLGFLEGKQPEEIPRENIRPLAPMPTSFPERTLKI